MEEVEKSAKRNAEFKEDARDGDGDGLVQDGTVHERPVKKSRTSIPTALVDGTVVRMSSVEYPTYARNSMSVSAVQVRLIELGYLTAGSDRRGWLGPGTFEALTKFQEDAKIEQDAVSLKTVSALFEGTKVQIQG